MNNDYNIGGDFYVDEKYYIHSKSESILFKKMSSIEKNFTLNGISSFFQILIHLKKEKKINMVYIPAFICDCLIPPINKLNMKYSFYSIDKNFNGLFDAKKNCAVLILNYFGLKNDLIDKLKNNEKNNFYIIEDGTHSLLNQNYNFNNKNHFKFISLRKHGYLGAGGWANINSNLNKKNNSVDRIVIKDYFLRKKKYNYIKNNLYIKKEKEFLNNFKKINNIYLKKLSKNVIPEKNLIYLKKFDFDNAINIRLKNWRLMNKILKNSVERVMKKVSKNRVPLGFIILIKNRDKVRKELIKNRIFSSIHWPLPKEIKLNNFNLERKISKRILTIPIDHRFNSRDVEYTGEILNKLV